MNFLRLSDYLISTLFEDDDIVAIDKPYGINTHTNDSKIEHSEFIQDGLIEMLEKLLGRKLYIIHRLDQTTSGVIVFGKSPEGAKKYSEFFFNRQVKKTYWFVTAKSSAQPEFEIDQAIIHKGKELEASTQFQLLKRAESFELWAAKPWTGRNHQIRIHAKAGGISILGDDLYEGAPYPFLFLHNHRIEFPNGVTIVSEPPVYFQDLALLKDKPLSLALFECDRRKRLFSTQNEESFRLVHSEDFSLDQYGPELILNSHKDSWSEADDKRFNRLATVLDRRITFRAPNLPVPELRWTAKENDLLFECRANNGPYAGVFLNQRLQRHWVRQNAKGKAVLNLFAQNCGFGVAAAKGGAGTVTSVEANTKALNWGKRNFELNSVDLATCKFLCRDSLVFAKQVLKQESKFDLVICDTPSFYRGEKGIFKIEKDLEGLLENCLTLLKPDGQLLFSTAYEGFFIDDLRQLILKVQKTLQLNLKISCIQSALDFELPNQRPGLKSFLIQI
jgi:23S rRNA (cytosine1962-C5)-methyltransferase